MACIERFSAPGRNRSSAYFVISHFLEFVSYSLLVSTWKLDATTFAVIFDLALHEPRLTVLYEVCTVLQALMMLDQLLDDEIDDDGEKNDELRPTNSSLPASDCIARRTDETVFLTHRR